LFYPIAIVGVFISQQIAQNFEPTFQYQNILAEIKMRTTNKLPQSIKNSKKPAV